MGRETARTCLLGSDLIWTSRLGSRICSEGIRLEAKDNRKTTAGRTVGAKKALEKRSSRLNSAEYSIKRKETMDFHWLYSQGSAEGIQLVELLQVLGRQRTEKRRITIRRNSVSWTMTVLNTVDRHELKTWSHTWLLSWTFTSYEPSVSQNTDGVLLSPGRLNFACTAGRFVNHYY